MTGHGNDWAIVLAAGEGTRLRSLATDGQGQVTPKQYCSLRGGATLLEWSLQRAERVVPSERTLAVVAAEHGRWWRPQLSELPEDNVVVQPLNRGTAAGVLLPLLEVLDRDPEARVIVLPSDHFVAREAILQSALQHALADLARRGRGVTLLGVEPDGPVPDYGWILPGGRLPGGTLRVAAFVEKPDPAAASELMRRGGVWNSFVFAADAPALLGLYERRLPALLSTLRRARAAGRRDDLAAAYAALAPSDFSRDLLQGVVDSLTVLPVADCGWTDLGTPERVARCIERLPARHETPAAMAGLRAGLDLSWTARSMQPA